MADRAGLGWRRHGRTDGHPGKAGVSDVSVEGKQDSSVASSNNVAGMAPGITISDRYEGGGARHITSIGKGGLRAEDETRDGYDLSDVCCGYDSSGKSTVIGKPVVHGRSAGVGRPGSVAVGGSGSMESKASRGATDDATIPMPSNGGVWRHPPGMQKMALDVRAPTDDGMATHRSCDGDGHLRPSSSGFGALRNDGATEIPLDDLSREWWEWVPDGTRDTMALAPGEAHARHGREALGQETGSVNSDDATSDTVRGGGTSASFEQDCHKQACGSLSEATDSLASFVRMGCEKLSDRAELLFPNVTHVHYTFDSQGQPVCIFRDSAEQYLGKWSPASWRRDDNWYDRHEAGPALEAGQPTGTVDGSIVTGWVRDDNGRGVADSEGTGTARRWASLGCNVPNHVGPAALPDDVRAMGVRNSPATLGTVLGLLGEGPISVLADNAEGHLDLRVPSSRDSATMSGHLGYAVAGISENAVGHEGASNQRLGSLRSAMAIGDSMPRSGHPGGVGDLIDNVGFSTSHTGAVGHTIGGYHPLDRGSTDTPRMTNAMRQTESWFQHTVENVSNVTSGGLRMPNRYDAVCQDAAVSMVRRDSSQESIANTMVGLATKTQPDEGGRTAVFIGADVVSSTYPYDGDGRVGRRVVRLMSVGGTDDDCERNGTANEWTERYYADGIRVARQTSAAECTLPSDHLEGDREPDETNVDDGASWPNSSCVEVWGASSPSMDSLYTWQQLQVKTGLCFYGAWMCEPMIRPPVSVDAIGSESRISRTLSRYTFLTDDSLGHVDPTVRDPLAARWEKWFEQSMGCPPSDKDRRDRLFSLLFPGTGSMGAWTEPDWKLYLAADFTDENGDRGNSYFSGIRKWPGAPKPGLDRFSDHVERLA